MLHDAWTWEEYRSSDDRRRGFRGQNEQATLTLSLDFDLTSGVWHEHVRFSDDDPSIADEIEDVRSVTDAYLVTTLPRPLWPRMAELTDECRAAAESRLSRAQERLFEAIREGATPSEVIGKSRIEQRTATYRTLAQRAELLRRVADGETSPTRLLPKKPKPATKRAVGKPS